MNPGKIGLIIGFIDLALAFVEMWFSKEIASWLALAGIVVVSVSIVYIYRKHIIMLYKKLHEWLYHLVPWLITAVLVLSSLIYLMVRPAHIPDITTIDFDVTKGGLFNSWDDLINPKKHLSVWGNPGSVLWVIDEHGAANFTYQTYPIVVPFNSDESSGGYMTFYDNPCDLSIYRKISFACRATNTDGKPDVGIRLAVNDQNGKERVTYEIPTLNTYYKGARVLGDTWQTFTIDVGDFKLIHIQPPLPKGMNKNAINKIVFFINNEIVKKCPNGTLWFRDVTFNSKRP